MPPAAVALMHCWISAEALVTPPMSACTPLQMVTVLAVASMSTVWAGLEEVVQPTPSFRKVHFQPVAPVSGRAVPWMGMITLEPLGTSAGKPIRFEPQMS